MTGLELKGLRGLKDLDTLIADSKKTHSKFGTLRLLPINKLTPGKFQPRTIFNDESLKELADSIKAEGIIQPLVVREFTTEQYEIIAGERRWRAAKIAGLIDVPVIIRNVPNETVLAFAIIENIQREDLNPIDQAIALSRLKEEFSLTHEEIASRVGMSRSAVSNFMRLLSLSEDIKKYLANRMIEMGHARALLALETDIQLTVAKRIINENISVRETERLIQQTKRNHDKVVQELTDPRIEEWSEILTRKLSSTVNIKINNYGVGKLVISVNSIKELEWLVENMEINLKK